MHNGFVDYIYLILIILALVMLANRLKLAYPIVLVLGGLALSFVVRFHGVAIRPDLIFFIFLPPLLYEAAWQTSWRSFWKWRRVITSFAFPIVILTSCVVAFASNAIIPGFTLALGFLLGGIVSPPDAVSATSIMKNVKVPRSMVSIIEGESLLNDASSLIVFRFALAAVLTGQFHLGNAVGTFFLVVIMGVAIGLAVGLIFYGIHRLLPTTSSIEVVLTLVTPYCMYYTAEYFHFSGVLAVVSGGLLLSNQRQSMLSYRSRIEGVNVWANLTFVFNGLIFLLIGLQLPTIIADLGNIGFTTALGYGLAISLVLIVARILCALGASLFTMFMSRFITVAEANPGWRSPLVLGWAGMRGVVSLAAALSIPVLMNDGTPFPHRNLILFITFIVILVTLVGQGLTLPWLIRKLNIDTNENNIAEQELQLRHRITEASLKHLQERLATETFHGVRISKMVKRLQEDLLFLQEDIDDVNNAHIDSLADYQDIYLDTVQYQRNILNALDKEGIFEEELTKKYAALLDIEEYKVRAKLLNTSDLRERSHE